MKDRDRPYGFVASISEDPETVLYAERLRDGRVALGTRTRTPTGDWQPGDMHLLEPPGYLGLAAWLAHIVEEAWTDTVRGRVQAQRQTAEELYGEGGAALRRLLSGTLAEIAPEYMARALILLANSIGPEARQRLVARLNETQDVSEEAMLRRRMADESEVLAYSIAAAALFVALEGGEEGADEAGLEGF